MTSTCLVTGAAGFIGSHLAASMLRRGGRVVGIDNFDPFYERATKQANLRLLAQESFDFVEADICEAETLRDVVSRHQPSALFHFAALAGVRPSIRDPRRYAAVNVEGLVNVLEAARGAACRNVVFASSSSVYGNRSRVPFSETDDVSEPISPYAATKCAGELICHTYAHLFGMSIAILRLFTVYGPRQRPDLAISRFMRLIADGRPIAQFGDGTTSRDYTFVDDIVRGVHAAHDRVKEQAGGFCRVYNLGGSSPVMLSRLIELIGEVVGRRPKIDVQPMQPGDVERTYADLRRSRSELGFQPATALEEGLHRQWDWMSGQVNG